MRLAGDVAFLSHGVNETKHSSGMPGIRDKEKHKPEAFLATSPVYHNYSEVVDHMHSYWVLSPPADS